MDIVAVVMGLKGALPTKKSLESYSTAEAEALAQVLALTARSKGHHLTAEGTALEARNGASCYRVGDVRFLADMISRRKKIDRAARGAVTFKHGSSGGWTTISLDRKHTRLGWAS